jgi:hypothetical protein
MIDAVQYFANLAWWVTGALGFLCIVTGLSRAGSRRFRDRSYWEVVRYNPPGALMASFGRAFPALLKAVLAAGSIAVIVTLIAWAT